MADFTPGPWAQAHRKQRDGMFRTQVFPLYDADNPIADLCWHRVTTENGFTTDREANARLIAASPDLLEALEDMTKLAIQLGAIDLEVEAALAAIAKAKGGA